MNETTRTLAFQIPEEMFWRIKDHLAREMERTGKKLSQKDFVLGLIEQALEESERAAGIEPGGSEAAEDNGAPESCSDSEADAGS